ncbi:Uncharacterized protein AXF42_Ash019255 [Apostasia shenzhenica]|uniref:Uncharacterized protein n=1 Tax=Apostasia shenzhenica TaxID=1088818 RepID=A0A2I0A329_9ASPA|nr:Uncharacterized protein AXF42_Ash019255 [Apostasia shenzhenica]
MPRVAIGLDPLSPVNSASRDRPRSLSSHLLKMTCCCILAGTTVASPSLDGRRASNDCGLRCRTPLFGAMQSFWYSVGHDLTTSMVRVAADYSDSAADSSKYLDNEKYHPLEVLKDNGKNRDLLLTDAEIARTIVEANCKALLVFPGRIHCEPHGHISWSEFHYVIDDYGDIFFEIFDDENILQDRDASNPVTVLIGMDIPISGESNLGDGNFYDYMDYDGINDDIFDGEYKEILDTEVSDTLIKWGMPDTLRGIHPVYFSKYLTKSAHSKHKEKMECPSNRVSIMGCIRPAFVDEETYLRGLFLQEDDDDYVFDWRDIPENDEEQINDTHELIDGEIMNFNSRQDRGNLSSTIYKLEIMNMELYSVYGDQSTVDLHDFQDAEPDVLAHSASSIIKRFNEYKMQCDAALKALCRKRKGIIVERANLIGVDGLGMDIRVSIGLEARTLRFSFNARAMTESSAEKKIRRMLFPNYHRKKSRSPSIGARDLSSY